MGLFLIGSQPKDTLKARTSESVSPVVAPSVQQFVHDMRSPLSVLNACAAALSSLEAGSATAEAGNPSIPQSVRSLISRAQSRIENMLLDLEPKKSQPQKTAAPQDLGTRQVQAVRVGVASVCQEFRFTLDSQIVFLEKHGKLTASSDSVQATLGQLQRVITNLLQNATESGAKLILIYSWEDMAGLHLVIRDHGPGMPSEIAAQIGQRGQSFGQKPAGAGRGLGLAHAIEVLQNAGGNLKLTTAPGWGTRFSLFLPFAKRS